MKKILSLTLVLTLLLGAVCIFPANAEETSTDKYKDKVLALLDIPENEPETGEGWLEYYNEGYEYYSPFGTTDETVPDYVLIEAYTNMGAPCTITEFFGDYVMHSNNLLYPGGEFGYHIYLPKTNEIYTLCEAYEMGIEGIYNVFTEGGLGELIGDVNFDNKLNIRDATLLQKHIAGIDKISNYSGYFDAIDAVADFNRDKKVNIRDATAIQKRLAGIDIDAPEYNPQLPTPLVEYAYVTANGETYKLLPGDEFTVNVELSCEEVLGGIDFYINFNPYVTAPKPKSEDIDINQFVQQHCPELKYYNTILDYPYNKPNSSEDRIFLTTFSSDGYDFKDKKLVCSFDFTVEKAGKSDFTLSHIFLSKPDMEGICQHIREDCEEAEFTCYITVSENALKEIEHYALDIQKVNTSTEHKEIKKIAKTPQELETLLSEITETEFAIDSKFTEEYFYEKSVVVIADVIGGSCCTQLISDVNLQGSKMNVYRTRNIHSACNDDINYQYALIEVDKAAAAGITDINIVDQWAMIYY